MRDWIVPIIVSVLGTSGTAGFMAIARAIRGRGRGRVDAVAALSETARKWVADFEAEAVEARSEARRTREELRACRTEAHALADELRNLRLAILHPAATLDGLRALVRSGNGPGDNGAVNLRRT